MSARSKARRRAWRREFRVRRLPEHGPFTFFRGIVAWFSADPHYMTRDAGGAVLEWRCSVGGPSLRACCESAATLVAGAA